MSGLDPAGGVGGLGQAGGVGPGARTAFGVPGRSRHGEDTAEVQEGMWSPWGCGRGLPRAKDCGSEWGAGAPRPGPTGCMHTYSVPVHAAPWGPGAHPPPQVTHHSLRKGRVPRRFSRLPGKCCPWLESGMGPSHSPAGLEPQTRPRRGWSGRWSPRVPLTLLPRQHMRQTPQ